MIIRMKKLAMGPDVNWTPGTVIPVDDETGQMFIDAGAAERVDTPPVTVNVDSEDAGNDQDGAGAAEQPADGVVPAPKPKRKSSK